MIKEECSYEIDSKIINILLKDNTTNKNICWACEEYSKYGESYIAEKEITINDIKFIQPRIAKSKAEQINRTKKSAEVFTPSWICNQMNNHCDEEWFGRKDVFNIEQDKTWQPTENPIEFNQNEWQKYVDSTRLEITCGEAPFLVSRYDTTTGEYLPIKMRIGILDRKLRVVNENTANEKDWLEWAQRAFEATYGYEYQGDNLLLARKNLFLTFIDYYKNKFNQEPSLNKQINIAEIISWNLWQMDGLQYTTPFSKELLKQNQYEMFDEILSKQYVSMFSKIKDWKQNEIIDFKDLINNE